MCKKYSLENVDNLPVILSTPLPPLSDPALPPCSAGEVRKVEPSVAAVEPKIYYVTRLMIIIFLVVRQLSIPKQ